MTIPQALMNWNNFSTIPNRWMARYLRRRGWVVFYLDEVSRYCGQPKDGCWLALYQESERREHQR